MARALSPRLLVAAVLALCALLALPAASQAKRKSACANVNVTPAAENLELVRAAVLCLHNRERAARRCGAGGGTAPPTRRTSGSAASSLGTGREARRIAAVVDEALASAAAV